MAECEGFGQGITLTDYLGTGNSIPLLSSFYFRFEKPGSSQTVDNHINSILVLPGGQSKDLTPNADLSPAQIPDGKIQLMFKDKEANSPEDNYFYKVAHNILPNVSAQRFQFRNVGCKGKCIQTLPPPPSFGQNSSFHSIFVLVGFHLFFTDNKDYHIDTITVFEDNGKLTVEFNDMNDNNVFGYLVDYAWVIPGTGQIISMGVVNGSSSGNAHVDLLAGQKVIRGFSFDFKSKDHHCRELGVVTANEGLEVFYSGKNGNDPIQWSVHWASITPQVM